MKLKSLYIVILTLLLLFINKEHAYARVIEGYVFLDENSNGMLDKTEKGIADIWVSNQRDFVQTDKNGYYKLELIENKTIYVVKPGQYTMNQFYLRRDGILNNNYNFPLLPKQVKTDFDVLIVGDPQMRSIASLEAFKEDIVEEMASYNPEFALILGDIADNDLSIYPYATDILKTLHYPVYKTFGNHDTTYESASDEGKANHFVHYFGPDYYSFTEGKVHFVVLNNINYQGWNVAKSAPGSYFGGLSEMQYQWLQQDLSLTPKDELVVLAMHIPLLEQYTYKKDIQRIFSLLKERENVLALSGHLHAIENYFFNSHTNWPFQQSFQNITVGAACGSWWCGPMDERNLPVATCMDGSPNGYYRFSFSGNTYDYQFIPANHRSDFQMRITFEENTNTLYANVFTATKEAAVYASVNNGERRPMKNICDSDPFINQTYDKRSNFDKWSPKKTVTNHLWSIDAAQLKLIKGINRIDISVGDVDGKQYKGCKLITIK